MATKCKTYTDDWGVTYDDYGRVLKEINPLLFTCEEYAIPEGVEIMEGAFWLVKKKPRKVRLPSTLRKMEANTFIRCPLEELELPEGITEVPEYMCESCEDLKKVVLPSTIKKITIGAFNCCLKLQEINLPDGLMYVEDGTFRYCESLKQVQLPSRLETISPEMFYCSGIETIEIPEHITKIGYWAFWGCNHLRRLIIPENVRIIDYGIVSAHEGFEGIVCHAKGCHVENDALIDDEKHELLCCWTQQTHYVVPESVKRIGDLGGNDFVETITVKQHVEANSDTFASDTNLKRIDFLGGVSGINKESFWNCPQLDKSNIMM